MLKVGSVDSASLVVRLGPFEVATDAADVAAFWTALGPGDLADGSRVPLTYPIRWLASAEIQSELRKVAGDERVLLVHESQSFAYRQPLEAGRSYRLDLTLRRESGRDERAVLHGVVRDGGGSRLAEVETVLRLVSAPGGEDP